MGVSRGSKVFIVGDEGTYRKGFDEVNPAVTHAFRDVALELGAQVTVRYFPKRTEPMKELPGDIMELTKHGDFTHMLGTYSNPGDEIWAKETGSKDACVPKWGDVITDRSVDKGEFRYAVCARLTPQLLAMLQEANFDQIYGLNEKLKSFLETMRGEEIIYETRKTDKDEYVQLYSKIPEDKKFLIEHDMEGALFNFPCGEAFTQPVADYSHGTLILPEGSDTTSGRLEHPAKFEVDNGRILLDTLKTNDKRLTEQFNELIPKGSELSELGIGTLPITLSDLPITQIRYNRTILEKMRGTFHIAYGFPVSDPKDGQIGKDVGHHVDLVLPPICRMTIGGHLLVDNGKLNIPD